MHKHKKHSILLNQVLWQMLEVLGEVKYGESVYYGTPKKIIKKFFKKINNAN